MLVTMESDTLNESNVHSYFNNYSILGNPVVYQTTHYNILDDRQMCAMNGINQSVNGIDSGNIWKKMDITHVKSDALYPQLDPRLISINELNHTCDENDDENKIKETWSQQMQDAFPQIHHDITPMNNLDIREYDPSQHYDEVDVVHDSTVGSESRTILSSLNKLPNGKKSYSKHQKFHCTYENCEATFKKRSEFKKHYRKHLDEIFRCPYYSAMKDHKGKQFFSRMDVWKRHLRTFHYKFLDPNSSNKGMGSCTVCDQVFSFFNDFADNHIDECAHKLRQSLQEEKISEREEASKGEGKKSGEIHELQKET